MPAGTRNPQVARRVGCVPRVVAMCATLVVWVTTTPAAAQPRHEVELGGGFLSSSIRTGDAGRHEKPSGRAESWLRPAGRGNVRDPGRLGHHDACCRTTAS